MNSAVQTNIRESIAQLLKPQNDLFNEVTREELESMLARIIMNMETESQKLMSSLLIDAIQKRMKNDSLREHIYLKDDEVPQIQLFNILIEKFPFVKYSQIITNTAIVKTIAQASEATIIDIGIGQGTQILSVIEMASQLTSLKKLRIIGIEPFKEALEIAEARIKAAAEHTHFDIEFTGIHSFIETVDFSVFQNLSETLVVNASLALHHIQSAEQRAKVIANIRQLNPTAFLLIEPNVDHFETNFARRFNNCYNHYYNIFMVIDRLDIDDRDKKALKLFFGREISDVIGNEEKDRFEKHEKATTWISRLRTAGFTLDTNIMRSPVEEEAGVVIRYHDEGFLGFTHGTETVLAVMYAC